MQSEREKAKRGDTPATGGDLAQLEVRLGQVHARREAIPVEYETTKRKIAEAIEALASIETRVEAAREERRTRLADGLDVKGISKELEAIRAEKELAEDMIAGFEHKLTAMEQEDLGLARDVLPQLYQAIARQRVDPLLDAYNTAARHLAEITEAIYEQMEMARQPFSPTAPGWFSPSSWEAFETIPRLCRSGEPAEHFFHRPWFEYRRQQSRAAA